MDKAAFVGHRSSWRATWCCGSFCRMHRTPAVVIWSTLKKIAGFRPVLLMFYDLIVNVLCELHVVV